MRRHRHSKKQVVLSKSPHVWRFVNLLYKYSDGSAFESKLYYPNSPTWGYLSLIRLNKRLTAPRTYGIVCTPNKTADARTVIIVAFFISCQ